MISSNDSANASSRPAMSAVRIAGSVTRRNVVPTVGAEVTDASSGVRAVRRSRATTLL